MIERSNINFKLIIAFWNFIFWAGKNTDPDSDPSAENKILKKMIWNISKKIYNYSSSDVETFSVSFLEIMSISLLPKNVKELFTRLNK